MIRIVRLRHGRNCLSDIIIPTLKLTLILQPYMNTLVWSGEGFLEMCINMGLHVVAYQPRDDKVGNGFCCVIKKAEKIL